MGFLDQLKQGAGQAFNSAAQFAGGMNNETYGAAQRGLQMISRGIANAPTRAIEAINPKDAQSQAARQTQAASQQYGFTPSFLAQIHSADPTYSSNLNGAALEDGKVDGTQQNDILHRIQLNPQAPDINGVIQHEGLHDTYATLKPETKTLFDSLVNQAMNHSPDVLGQKYTIGPGSSYQDVTSPGLRTWLANRTAGYKAQAGVKSFYDVSSMPDSIQNEIHSYIPEYYASTKQQMPTGLRDYYANYYNTGGQPTQISQMNPVEQLLGKLF